MKCLGLAVFVLAFMAIGASSRSGHPHAEIKNEYIRAKIYLPDAEKGYYRGARFDWSGVMPELEYNGHTYFGQWFEKQDPTAHDAITGPVEAFSPLGYQEAKKGDTFVKIGIGSLIKPDDSEYLFSKGYEISNSGKWEIKKHSNQVHFMHRLEDVDYGYEYQKTVELVEGEAKLVLKHSLKNTGQTTIETDVYNHNFFVMDQQPTGPDFTVTFPFLISTEAPITTDLVDLSNDTILFKRKFSEKESIFMKISGFSNLASDYDFRIENHKTGAGVRIMADQPLSQLAFWAAAKTISPEPYIHVKIEPGEIMNWDITYDFYLLNASSVKK